MVDLLSADTSCQEHRSWQGGRGQPGLLADVVRFGGVYNSVEGDKRFQGRHDFNGDGRVSLSDVILFGPMYNRSCAS